MFFAFTVGGTHHVGNAPTPFNPLGFRLEVGIITIHKHRIFVDGVQPVHDLQKIVPLWRIAVVLANQQPLQLWRGA